MRKFNNVDVNDIDGKVSLIAFGENLRNDDDYFWNIQFDKENIRMTTIGTILVMNKNNSEKFNNSNKVSVKIYNRYLVSDNFIVKDVRNN